MHDSLLHGMYKLHYSNGALTFNFLSADSFSLLKKVNSDTLLYEKSKFENNKFSTKNYPHSFKFLTKFTANSQNLL